MNQVNKDAYNAWKNYCKTVPAGQRSIDTLMAMYHEDFKEIWVDGSTYTKSDLRTQFAQYLGKHILPVVYLFNVLFFRPSAWHFY